MGWSDGPGPLRGYQAFRDVMFTRSARYYDIIYGQEDYAGSIERVRALIAACVGRPVETLLDVACWTGLHLALLSEYYTVEAWISTRHCSLLRVEGFPACRFTRPI